MNLLDKFLVLLPEWWSTIFNEKIKVYSNYKDLSRHREYLAKKHWFVQYEAKLNNGSYWVHYKRS